MRALHVLETLAAGGVETTFLNVLRHLPHDGVRHDVLAFEGGALEPGYRAAAEQVTIARSSSDLRAALTRAPYDVVYVLFERCAERIVPTLMAETPSRIVYGKNYDFSGQWRSTEGFVSHVDDALVTAADAVTFTTAPLAAAYGDEAAARGTVLGKGADVTRLLELPEPDASAPNRILAIANPTPRKRLGDLLIALSRVREQAPDAEVRIVGRGDAQETMRLERLAVQAGLADAFVLGGHVADVARELAQARIVALPSGSEGVPTALLEAMAAGRPVVTSNAGHVDTILDHGIEGFVHAIGDVAALADALSALLVDRALAAEMGRRGRERARRHAVEAVAARLWDVLVSAVRH